MKKILFIFLIFFFTNKVFSETNINYLDVQFIIDNSNLGKLYKSEIKKIQDKNKTTIINKEQLIKKKETEFNNQKNILNQDEIKKKLNEINLLINEYQSLRKKFNSTIIAEKKKYSLEILKILNPLLTEYVEKNNIEVVIEKKNVLVGIKNLDITNDILLLFNDKTKNLIKSNEN